MTGKALVTGGAGFLGSHLCERLLREGWRVECIDNLVTGRETNLEALLPHPGFTFRRLDVSKEPVETDGADVLFHLACPASPVQYSRIPIETLEASAVGTSNALSAARRHSSRFVLASTSEVYGDPREHPQSESYWGNVDPIGPRSMYDEGKRYAEALATWHGRVHGMDVRIVRIFNTYGPRMGLEEGRVVPTFVRQALRGEPLTVHGDGTQTRSLCFVSDLIDALVRVSSLPVGEISESPTNLGNPQELRVAAIADTVVRLAGSSSPIRNVPRPLGDPSRRRPDITRARRLLGWEPQVGLEEGLLATIEWAREELAAAGEVGLRT